MSNTGQAVLQVVGFVASAYTGNPYFYMAATMAGSVLFPTKLPDVFGPRLIDARGQTADYGVPIHRIHGTTRVAGNLIWSAGIKETATTTNQGGGKGSGGGQDVTTYSYRASFAVGICEGEITGIRSIWADGALVFSVDSEGNSLLSSSFPMTIYGGSEFQLPDSTIEAIEGEGEAPAYRGTAYVVFEDLQLADYGNRIPNLEFEMYSSYNLTYSDDVNQSTPVIFDPGTTTWGYFYEINVINPEGDIALSFGHSNATKAAVYVYDKNLVLIAYTTTLNKNTAPSSWKQTIGAAGRTGVGYVICEDDSGYWGTKANWYVLGSGDTKLAVYDTIGVGRGQIFNIGDFLFFWTARTIKQLAVIPSNSPAAVSSGKPYEISTSATYSYSSVCSIPFSGWDWDRRSSFDVVFSDDRGGYRWVMLNANGCYVLLKWDSNLEIMSVIDSFNGNGSSTYYHNGDWNGDYLVGNTGAMGNYENDNPLHGTGGLTLLKASASGWEVLVDDGKVISKPKWINDTTFVSVNDLGFVIHELDKGAGTVDLIQDDGYYNPTTLCLDHRVYNTDTNNFCNLVKNGNSFHIQIEQVGITPITTQLSAVVSDICTNSNLLLSDIDVSELTDEVDGYAISSKMSGRLQLEPLMIAYQFDAVERDNKIVFVKRGGSSVGSLVEDDLAAHEDGSTDLVTMPTVIRQQTELPLAVDIKYGNKDRDYLIDQQEVTRLKF